MDDLSKLFFGAIGWMSNYSEALFGFFGVIIGGLITFATESHFRKKDRFAKNKLNYILAINQISKVYSEQNVLLKNLTKFLPEQEPEIFVNNVMPVFSNSTKPVDFNVERLVALAVKGKTFFGEAQLSFDRYDAVIQLFSDFQKARNGLDKYSKIDSLQLNRNSAVLEFDLSDPKFITHFLTVENLLRILMSHLYENINDCQKLLSEVTDFGHKKYKVEYEFLTTPAFPPYIGQIEEITVGDLPPFKNRIKPAEV